MKRTQVSLCTRTRLSVPWLPTTFAWYCPLWEEKSLENLSAITSLGMVRCSFPVHDSPEELHASHDDTDVASSYLQLNNYKSLCHRSRRDLNVATTWKCPQTESTVLLHLECFSSQVFPCESPDYGSKGVVALRGFLQPCRSQFKLLNMANPKFGFEIAAFLVQDHRQDFILSNLVSLALDSV